MRGPREERLLGDRLVAGADLEAQASAFTWLEGGEGWGQSWSREELVRRAWAVASALVELAPPQSPFLLAYPPGLPFLAAFYGCQLARMVAVPVPGQWEDAKRLRRLLPRWQAIAEDAKAAGVLTDRRSLASLGRWGHEAPALAALRWWALEGDEPGAEAWARPQARPEDLAFLQYSSGSTGRPKGVMVSQENLRVNAEALRLAFGHGPHSLSLSWLPVYHDLGLVAEVVQPVHTGHQAVFMSPFAFIERPLRWLEAIARFRATTSGGPNFAYALCANKAQGEALAGLDLSAWRLAYQCGEPVQAKDLDRFTEAFGPRGFTPKAWFPFLGMAEATLMVSAGPAESGPRVISSSPEALRAGRIDLAPGPRLVSCGRALPGHRLEVVDPEAGRPLPEGELGELWLSGPSVAQGYWGQEAASQVAFGARLPDGSGPFLRTGDRALMWEGELYLAGRWKDLIIVAGQNLHPQDLEATAEAAHPSLRPGCLAAFALPAPEEGTEGVGLVAELVQGAPADPEALAAIEAQVQASLWEAHGLAVTLRLLPTGALPKTTSGKVQRSACQEAFLAGSWEGQGQHAPAIQAPSSPEALAVGSLLQELLGVKELPWGQPFLALGGHSLLAARLASRLRSRLGVELPWIEVLQAPHLAALAERIATLPPTALPEPKAQGGRAPLSHAQEGLWFWAQWQGPSQLYLMTMALAIEGPVALDCLEGALQALMARHPAWRTRFIEGPPPQQELLEEARLPWARWARAEEVEAWVAQPMALTEGPLVRAGWWQEGPGRGRLLLTMHHLIADGWSWALLAKDLEEAYRALKAGQSPFSSKAPGPGPGDWARVERAWWTEAREASLAARWRARLAGVPTRLRLPTLAPRPSRPRHQGGRALFTLEAPVAQGLAALAQGHGLTPFEAALGLYQVLLHHHSGMARLCVGTPVAQRPTEALEATVGLFVNSVVLPSAWRPEEGMLAQALAHQAELRQDLQAGAWPFDRLVAVLKPPRDPSAHPCFQAYFVFQDAEMSAWSLEGLAVRWEEWPQGGAKFDLNLELIPGPGAWQGRLEYDLALFGPEAATQLIEGWVALAQAWVARPQATVAELCVGLPPLPGAVHPWPEDEVGATPLEGPEASGADEALVAAAFQEVLSELQLPPMDREAHFFDLGGHSLLALRLQAKLQATSGVKLPLQALFEAPTVGALASRLGALRQANEAPPTWQAPEAEPWQLDEDGWWRHPAAEPQAQMALLDQLGDRPGLYVHRCAFRVRGALPRHLLEQAFAELVAQHPALRTRLFWDEDGRCWQATAPELNWAWAGPAARVASEAEAWAHAEGWWSAPMPVEAAPPLEALSLEGPQGEAWLFLKLHHALLDGASLALLLGELGRRVEALQAGQGLAVVPPPMGLHPQAQHRRWQEAWLASPEAEAQRQHWRARLEGHQDPAPLPCDRPRPPVASTEGGQLHLRWPQATGAAVEALAKAWGVSPFVLLLGTFQLLLARCTRQPEVLVGVPVAQREEGPWAGALGLFVNTLPMRARLDLGASFQERLPQLQAEWWEAQRHQALPLDEIVGCSGVPRGSSHPPLVQVMFAAQDPAVRRQAWGEAQLEAWDLPWPSAKFEWSVDWCPEPEGWHFRHDYRRELFDRATIEALAEAHLALVEGLLTSPERPMGQLPLLLPEREVEVLEAWNATDGVEAEPACIHRLIEAQVARSPEATALIFGEESLSYRELERRANLLAWALVEAGLQPEAPVGVCMERSLALPVALLGILKAGGAYLPLDPAYPAERVRFMREDAQAAWVLTEGQLPSALDWGPELAWPLDRFDWDRPDPGPPPLGRASGLDDLISIIYTSGSTGRPKGVLNLHRGVYNHLSYRQRAYPMGPHDRVMQKTSISFDGSVWEIFWPLMVGAQMHLAPPSAQKDASYLCAFVAEHGITLIDFVPSMLHEVLSGPEHRQLGSIRRFFVGGEALTLPLQEALFAKLPTAELTHGYGPTETTVSVLYHDCQRDDALGKVPIGRPIANTQVYVLDEAMQPLPVGIPGELHIGGHGLARGYHRRPELSAERFVPHPWRPGQRLYKSGDLCRWLPSGSVEFLGRVDDQVKIRGFRVELGEIEQALLACREVREAVVLLREDSPGDKRLVAYLVLQAPVGWRELKAQLALELPEHMLPAACVVLERLPLAPNDKVDRRALPAPRWDREVAGGAYEAPADPTEEALCTLFAELLDLPQVGATDPFFELGGHSLLATRLVARVQARLGWALPLRAVFEEGSPRALARLRPQMPSPLGGEAPALGQALGPLPLSPVQEGMWFLEQLHPGTTRQVIPSATWLEGPLDPKALALALGDLVERHEALRTRFVLEAGEPSQAIDPPGPCPLPLQEAPGASQAWALAWAKGELAQPFELSRDWPLRASLLHLSTTRHLLALAIHHLASDGWSWRRMTQELEVAYGARRQGEAPRWPQPPCQYAAFTLASRSAEAQAEVERALAQALVALGGMPTELRWPEEPPQGPEEAPPGQRWEQALPSPSWDRLQAMAQAHGLTPFMWALAAWELVLHTWTGQGDFGVGVPVANRARPEWEGALGCFVNTVVVRAQVNPEASLAEHLQGVREACLASFSRHTLPLGRLVQALCPPRQARRHPLFQVLFVLQEEEDGGLVLPGVEAKAQPLETVGARFDLALELLPRPQGLVARVEHRSDLLPRVEVEAMLARWAQLLEAMAEEPLRLVKALPWRQAQTEGGLSLLAGPSAPAWETWWARWQEQIAACPAAQALSWGGTSWSHARLAQEAEAWARHLASWPEGTRVGLHLAASPAWVVGLLASLASGRPFVPLDPALPPGRLAALAQDAEVGLVLTEGQALPEALAAWPALDLGAPPPPREAALPSLGPEALAYLLYTSGSTGRPKGVLVPHRGLAALVLAGEEAYGLGPSTRMFQFASPSFDASIFEVLSTLGAGGCLVLAPRAEKLPGPGLAHLLEREQVNVLGMPPSALAHQPLPPSGHLRTLILAGEACPPELAARWAQVARVFNAYGPTEATVWTTVAPWHPPGQGPLPSFVPIGRPIRGAWVGVVDEGMQLVPPGVPGELLVGGLGVALGYQRRPEEQTARFVPDPRRPGAWCYRSGDRARLLPDGQLQFLGRLDEQVKVRGQRIELGEVEAALRACPGVAAAAVLSRPEHQGQALSAYLVPEPGAPGRAAEAAQVEAWRDLYEATPWVPPPEGLLGEDFTGWNSAFTGAPLPREAMEAWRSHLLAIILEGQPEGLYEVGAGHGLLVSQLAPQLARCWASDFAAPAVATLKALAQEKPGCSHLLAWQAPADDWTGLPEGAIDTVVLNSVAQYFPSAAYLFRVLQQAIARVGPGGRVIVGDVRILERLPLLHAEQAARGQPLPSQEEELCLSPAWFTSLPGVAVEFRHRHHLPAPELAHLRMDVILHVGAQTHPVAWQPWHPEVDLDALVWGDGLRGMRGVPMGSLPGMLRHAPPPGALDPLWCAHQGAPDRAWVLPAEAPGCFDWVLAPPGLWPAWPDEGKPRALANEPLPPSTQAAWLQGVKAALAKTLPEAMRPAHWVILPTLPLSPSGKVDKAALPPPTAPALQAGGQAPEGSLAATIAAAFAEVLGLEACGAQAGFFELGGHSLLAVRLQALLQARLGRQVALAELLEHPSPAALAAHLEAGAGPVKAPPPALPPLPAGRSTRLSWAQELWWALFPSQAELSHGIQNSYAIVRLDQVPERDAWEASLRWLVARHEALRTSFSEGPLGPRRQIQAPLIWPSTWHEPRDLELALGLAQDEAEAPFDLKRGPLFRSGLHPLHQGGALWVWSVSHLVFDGASLALVLQELGEAYEAALAGRPPSRPPLARQYSDHVAWQRGWPRVFAALRGLPRVLARGRGAPLQAALKTDFSAPSELGLAGGSVPFELPEALRRSLVAWAQREAVSLPMLMLAAFQVLLHRHSGLQELLVGQPVGVRPTEASRQMVGLFLNFVVLRQAFRPGLPFSAFLAEVKATCLEAWAHQDLPFTWLMRAFAWQQRLLGARGFRSTRAMRANVMFNMLEGFEAQVKLGPLRGQLQQLPSRNASQALHLILLHGRSGLQGQLVYHAELFKPESAQALAQDYVELLGALVADPHQPISKPAKGG